METVENSSFALRTLDDDALRLKATLASDQLRTLSRESLVGHRNAWQDLLTEFSKQKAFWDEADAQHDGRHWGTMASVKSKLECVIAMGGADDTDALLALEALLRTSGAVKETSSHKRGDSSSTTPLRQCAPVLSPAAHGVALDVLEQMQVRQARAELADYLDMVARADDGRYEVRQREWLVVVVKECDVREGILKELLNELITADDARRKLRLLERQLLTAGSAQLLHVGAGRTQHCCGAQPDF